MSTLSDLFKTYLGEVDEYDGVAVVRNKDPVVVARAVPAAAEPAPPVVAAVQEDAMVTGSVEIKHDHHYGLQQAWFSTALARKSAGPDTIRITFVELFYDLIFAAVLSSFAFNIALGWPGGKWLNFVQMIMLLALWHENATLTSTVYARDPLSCFILFLQMIGVLGMAFFRNVVSSGESSVFTGFVVSFLWARFFTIVLYLTMAGSKASAATRVASVVYAVWLALTCIPAAVTIGLANDVTVYGRVMIWLVGAGLDHVAAFALPLLLGWWRTALPVADLRHYKDRFGALLLFLFGYMLTALFFDETGPYTAGEWGSISLLFLIAFCFMWMYYGDRVDDERTGCVHPTERTGFLGTLLGTVWQACHLPLAMALIIMADASVQIVYYYRGIPRLPNAVVPGLSPLFEPVLILSNTVQWIYGVSFAIALGLTAVIGLLYEYHTRRAAKRRIERSVARFALVVVMVLIPLGGLNSPMTPIIQPIVGAIVMLALVVIDWAFNTALGPEVPQDVELRTVQVKAGPEIVALQQRVAQQEAELASLRQQLAAQPRAAPAAAAPSKPEGEENSSEISSSKEWGFSSRTSSVVEDVVVSDEASESHISDEREPESGSEKRDQPARPAAESSSEDTP